MNDIKIPIWAVNAGTIITTLQICVMIILTYIIVVIPHVVLFYQILTYSVKSNRF